VQPPDPSRPALDPGSLDAPGWRVEVLPESPSTNACVAERARAGASPGLAVVAEHQTAGRGRLDRVWVTPPRAALTVSLLVSPERVPLARWPWLPLLTGLAAREAVRRTAGVECALKWPNDVLVGERKLAGILVELVERPAGAVAVVGIGVNVTTTRDELPVDTATSLAIEGAESPDRTRLLGELLTCFTRQYDAWVTAGGDGLRSSYASACSTLGRRVRVGLPNGETLEGVAVDVDEGGRLVVDDGHRRQPLGAGDVVHVRAGGTDRPA
jgi:BirA family transcriptional regulator, biotin operon repressor / biotin---[acetyl-CoA-carboxylase] ligase